jgi:hypothetical protein
MEELLKAALHKNENKISCPTRIDFSSRMVQVVSICP